MSACCARLLQLDSQLLGCTCVLGRSVLRALEALSGGHGADTGECK